MTQEVQSPPTPSPSTSAHYLNDVEVEHNLIRFNSRQDLADHVDVLIDAHPDLVFNYQRMAESDDPVVASIARYRLAQVHLELGCALDEVSQQAKKQATPQPGLEPIAWNHLERAYTNFTQASAGSFRMNAEQTLEWREAYSAPSEPSTSYENGTPPSSKREECTALYHCCDFSLSLDETHTEPHAIERALRYETHHSALICETLRTEYLGPLTPFVY